jgi:hypothetical protein
VVPVVYNARTATALALVETEQLKHKNPSRAPKLQGSSRRSFFLRQARPSGWRSCNDAAERVLRPNRCSIRAPMPTPGAPLRKEILYHEWSAPGGGVLVSCVTAIHDPTPNPRVVAGSPAVFSVGLGLRVFHLTYATPPSFCRFG